MSNKNEGLQAAIDECDRLKVAYRWRLTQNSHIMFYVGDSELVLISNHIAKGNRKIIKNIVSDVRRAARQS